MNNVYSSLTVCVLFIENNKITNLKLLLFYKIITYSELIFYDVSYFSTISGVNSLMWEGLYTYISEFISMIYLRMHVNKYYKMQYKYTTTPV